MNQNPFLSDIFKRVDSQEMREKILHDPDPCIVLATGGMMNGGPVLEYVKNWADDPNSRPWCSSVTRRRGPSAARSRRASRT